MSWKVSGTVIGRVIFREADASGGIPDAIRDHAFGGPQFVAVKAGMADSMRFTAIIEREGDGYVALCPEYMTWSARVTPSKMHVQIS
jgi:hypothetical protein